MRGFFLINSSKLELCVRYCPFFFLIFERLLVYGWVYGWVYGLVYRRYLICYISASQFFHSHLFLRHFGNA